METNQQTKVEAERDIYDRGSISSFCDRVAAIVGSVTAAGIKAYEARGGSVIACDIAGSEGSISLTMFPDGKTNIPGAAEFTAGQLGSAPNEFELEFSVRDYATARLICARLADSLVFDVISEGQALLRDAASLPQPSSLTCPLDQFPVDQAHIQ